MILAYPLKAQDTKTYSHRIKDYTKLSFNDKQLLMNNFREFYKYSFWYLNLPYPTRDQLYMAKFCERDVNSKDKIPTMLQAQRGLAKSLTLQIFSVWLLYRNPDEKIVVVSATSKRAKSFVGFVLKLIKVLPILKSLEPQGDDRSSTEKFDVGCRLPDDSPSMCAFGVTSTKTGSRASFIIYDDVEVPENSGTSDKREKLLDGTRDTANLGIAGVFREICICTPQSSDSIYNTLIDDDGFRCTIIPAEYPENIEAYNGMLAKHISYICKKNPHLVGTNTDKRNNMEHLLKQKIKGKARYKLQYMLDTSLSDAEKYPLKLYEFMVYECDKDKAPISIMYGSERNLIEWKVKNNGFKGDFLYAPRYVSKDFQPYQRKILFVDPAGRGKDEVGYAIVGTFGSKFFILNFGGLQGGYSNENLEFLSELAKEYEVQQVVLEDNFGDGLFTKLFTTVLYETYKCGVEETKAKSQKEKRIIRTIEPLLMQRRLVIDKGSLLRDADKKIKYSFTYQISHITEQSGSLSHDDILDAVAGGIEFLKDEAIRSDSKTEKKAKENIAKEKAKEFLKKIKRSIKNPSLPNVADNY